MNNGKVLLNTANISRALQYFVLTGNCNFSFLVVFWLRGKGSLAVMGMTFMLVVCEQSGGGTIIQKRFFFMVNLFV